MDCIIIDDDLLSRKHIEGYIKKSPFLNLLQSFSDPISALSFLSQNNVDLLFLDIEMPEMDGIKFIKTIHQKMPQVILTTTHVEFALDAFDYNVTDYLLKPIEYSRFYAAIEKAKKNHDYKGLNNDNDDTVFVKNGTSFVRVGKADVLWVEALGDYITLHTATQKIVIHSTMNAMEEKLSDKDYIRVHRSYIVRIDKIDYVKDDTIFYKDVQIPIGKTYRNQVYSRLRIM